MTRAELVNPTPRQVLLVDHAEQAQSVPGVSEASIVEILDHHHIGSIETRFPVAATFDPVGSTATLVVERFRAHGREPQRPTATMLLAAILSDTVILSSPTTTERDHAGRRLPGGAARLRRPARSAPRCSRRRPRWGTSPAADIVRRDAKEYEVRNGRRLCVAQIETVGRGLLTRRVELLGAMEDVRERMDYVVMALMVTDIVEKGTELLAAGDVATVERAFGVPSRGRRAGPAGRDEPQEAGGAAAALRPSEPRYS